MVMRSNESFPNCLETERQLPATLTVEPLEIQIEVVDDLAAGRQKSGKEHLRRVVLGVECATDLAEARRVASGSVVSAAAPSPTEGITARGEELVVAIPVLGRQVADLEQGFDAPVQVAPPFCAEFGEPARARPLREHRLRRPLAQVEVVDRRPAHGPALVDADRPVVRRQAAALPEEPREHLLFTLVHRLREHQLACLEQHDLQTRLGRDHRRHRPAGARADDAEVCVERRLAREGGGVVDHRASAAWGRAPRSATHRASGVVSPRPASGTLGPS